MLSFTAGLGAVTAEALAERLESSVESARGRLRAAQREGQLASHRLIAGGPALYTVTPAGLRASPLTRGLAPCRVTPANASHLAACAEVAVALGRCFPGHAVIGERELRRDEREAGAVLASASLGTGCQGVELLHRPDLVLWPTAPGGGSPIAVEVELSVKSPRRLAQICRAWARCRSVDGVLYLVSAEVRRPLARAIESGRAEGRIVIAALTSVRTIPGGT